MTSGMTNGGPRRAVGSLGLLARIGALVRPSGWGGRHSRRPHAGRRALASLGLSALVLGVLAGGAPTAMADTTSWARYAGHSSAGGSWVGNFRSASSGDVAVCALQGGMLGPPGSGSGRPTTYSDPFRSDVIPNTSSITAGGEEINRGDLSGTAVWQIAYILSTYAGSSDNTEAAAADVAVLKLGGTWLDWQGSVAGSAAVALANEMIASAQANHGPYAVATPVVTKDGATGALENAGLLTGGAGQAISGYTITYTLSGSAGATWDANGSTSIAVTSGSAQRVAYTASQSGNVVVTATVTVPDGVWLMSPRNGDLPNAQNLMLTGRTRPISAVGDPVDMQLSFLPAVSSQVSADRLAPGSEFTDQVSVQAAAGQTWPSRNFQPLTIRAYGTLYGPFETPQATSDTVPAGAPVVGSTTVDFAGPGTRTVTMPGVSAEVAGWYAWVWSVPNHAGSQPDGNEAYITEPVSDAFFAQTETQQAAPFTPTITTQVAARVVAQGEELVDSVTVGAEGGDQWWGDVTGVRVTGTVYGPYDSPQPQGTAVDPSLAVGTQTLVVDGPGTYSSSDSPDDEPVASGPGFYTWVWSIQVADQDPDVRQWLTGDVSDVPWAVAETSVQPRQVTATSQVEPDSLLVMPGDSVTDVITLSGFPQDQGAFTGIEGWDGDVSEVVHTLYGPFETAPDDVEGSQVDLGNAPVAGRVTTPARNGQVSVTFEGDNAPQATGHYVVVTSFAGDSRTEAFQTSPYDPAEQLRVAAVPTAITQADPDAVVDLDHFGDTALVQDPHEVISTQPGYTWEVEFKAYYAGEVVPLELDADGQVVTTDEEALAAIQAVCEADPFFTSRTTITGAGSWESEETVATQAGNVFWVESIVRTPVDEDGNPLTEQEQYVSTGRCGMPNETTKVLPHPDGVTQAQPDALVGQAFTDTVTITDEADVIAREGFVWETVFRAFYAGETAPLEVDEDGNVVPTEVPVLDENGNPVLDVDGNPVTEQVLPQDVLAICDGEPFFTGRTVITGAGDFTSPETVATQAGNVFWVESIVRTPVDEDGNRLTEQEQTVTTGVCGLPGETTKVWHMPTVLTKAVPEITVGERAEDTAIVSDPDGAIASGLWSFDLTFRAYGPHKDADEETKGAPFFTSEVIAVTAAGEYTSGRTPVVNTAGNLYWVEDLHATPVDEDGQATGERFLGHAGVYGLPNETTIVKIRGGSGGGSGLGAGGADLLPLAIGGLLAAAGTAGVLLGRRRLQDD